jgi:hypothetical protein
VKEKKRGIISFTDSERKQGQRRGVAAILVLSLLVVELPLALADLLGEEQLLLSVSAPLARLQVPASSPSRKYTAFDWQSVAVRSAVDFKED